MDGRKAAIHKGIERIPRSGRGLLPASAAKVRAARVDGRPDDVMETLTDAFERAPAIGVRPMASFEAQRQHHGYQLDESDVLLWRCSQSTDEQKHFLAVLGVIVKQTAMDRVAQGTGVRSLALFAPHAVRLAASSTAVHTHRCAAGVCSRLIDASVTVPGTSRLLESTPDARHRPRHRRASQACRKKREAGAAPLRTKGCQRLGWQRVT